MLEQLPCICPLFRILIQAACYKVTESLTPFRVLQCGRIFSDDQVEDLLLGLRYVGGLAVGEFECEYPEWPDVDFDVVGGFATDKFGCHPAHRPYLAVSLGFLLCKLCRIPEICQLKVTLLIHKDVIRLDIPMHNILFMQWSQPFQGLIQDKWAYALGYIPFAFLNNGCEASAVHKLEEYPESLPVVECVKAPDYIIVILAHLHYSELISDDLTFFSVLRLDELERVLLAIVLALNQEDTRKTTITYLLHYLVVLRRVLLAELSSLFKVRGELFLCR